MFPSLFHKKNFPEIKSFLLSMSLLPMISRSFFFFIKLIYCFQYHGRYPSLCLLAHASNIYLSVLRRDTDFMR